MISRRSSPKPYFPAWLFGGLLIVAFALAALVRLGGWSS